MMLIRIDLWLLERLEKFAHWFQKLTGKNCFWLSRIFIIWGAMNFIGPHQLNILKENHKLTVLILIAGIVSVCAIGLWRQSKRHEKEVLRMNERGHANSFKITSFSFRIIWLLLAIFAIIISLILLLLHLPSFKTYDAFFLLNYALSWVLYGYFSACDPLPPAKSRVKEWKEKFVNAVKGVFAPVPRPVPAPCE